MVIEGRVHLGQSPEVLLAGDAALPAARQHGRTRDGHEEAHQEGCVDRHGDGARLRGRHGQGVLHRAGRHAAVASRAVVASDPLDLMHLDAGGADSRALSAVDAGGGSAGDFQWAQQGDESKQGTVGAEVAAPGVLDYHREGSENGQHDQARSGDPCEEQIHFHVGHAVVGAVEEERELLLEHAEDRPQEEGQEEILEAPKEDIQPAGQRGVPPEEAPSKSP